MVGFLIYMKFDRSRQNLVIFPKGRIDSTTAQAVETEIFEIAKNAPKFKKLILDFSDVDYISSAGLRSILRIKQNYDDLSIVETSLEVFDTFSMTGFTELMEIRKALRKIDISKAEVIGDGFFSTVYRLDGDTIVKVFNRTSDPHQIERELKLAKQAFILGIPTALSFDKVKAGDKLGVIFEMLDCKSLKTLVKENPDKISEYVDNYVALLKKIVTTVCDSPEIPKMKEFYQSKLEVIKPYLGDKYYEKAKKIIDNIEDRKTFVHGDCHFKNIMVQGDEFVLIDMDTLSVGHPIFEFAQLYAPYCAFEEDEPGNVKSFLGIEPTDARRLFNTLLNRYIGKEDPVILDKVRLVCYIHMVWWTIVNQPDNATRLNGSKERLLSLLDKYDDVNF